MRSRWGSSAVCAEPPALVVAIPGHHHVTRPGERVSQPGGRIATLRQGEKSLTERLLTTVVGSYPQPEWLVDRKNL